MTLSVQDLVVKKHGRNILRGVSLFFGPGLNLLMGRNGSGKSTLLESLAGFHIYEGSIRLGEREIREMAPRERARTLALIPQRSTLHLSVPVREFILMGRFPYLGLLGDYSREDHDIAEKWMRFAGLEAFAGRNIGSLSGGEFQKAVIARGLCQETGILLLDEPCQGLDPPNREMVYALLHQLAQEGKTLVCASHDAEPVLEPKARIFGMQNGQLALERMGGEDAWQYLRENLFAASRG